MLPRKSCVIGAIAIGIAFTFQNGCLTLPFVK